MRQKFLNLVETQTWITQALDMDRMNFLLLSNYKSICHTPSLRGVLTTSVACDGTKVIFELSQATVLYAIVSGEVDI